MNENENQVVEQPQPVTEQPVEQPESIEPPKQPQKLATPYRPPPAKQVEPLGRQYEYDVPVLDSDISPDEARTALKKLTADIQANQAGHPYMNGNHVLHDDYIEYKAALHEAAIADDENVIDEKLADVEAQKQERIEAMREQAQLDLDWLRDEGLETEYTIPADLPEAKARLLRMRCLNVSEVEQDKRLLATMLKDDLKRIKTLPKLEQLFSQFITATGFDKDLQEGLADEILLYLDRAYEAGVVSAPKTRGKRFGG